MKNKESQITNYGSGMSYFNKNHVKDLYARQLNIKVIDPELTYVNPKSLDNTSKEAKK